MILSNARVKKHKLKAKLLPVLTRMQCTYRDYRELDRIGQVSDLFYQSESVPGFYQHSSIQQQKQKC